MKIAMTIGAISMALCIQARAEEQPTLSPNANGPTYIQPLAELELEIPLELKSIVKVDNQDGVGHVGTPLFKIAHSVISQTKTALEPTAIEADMQTSAFPCEPDTALADHKKNFASETENEKRFLTVIEINSPAFDGYLFRAEDFRRSDTNTMIGTIDRAHKKCFTTSIVLFGVKGYTAPVVRHLSSPLVSRVYRSYEKMVGKIGQNQEAK